MEILSRKLDTCSRCFETGKTIVYLIEELTKDLEKKGVKVTFTETKILELEKPVDYTNMLIFNGVPFIDLIPAAMTSKCRCDACHCPIKSCLFALEKQKFCLCGKISEINIRWAVFKTMGLM
ncbi:MAG: DUF2703 domain-containing protein [Candidatus Hodarchaeota archaeon]